MIQEKDCFTREELDGIANKLSIDDPNQRRWTPLSLVLKPHHNVFTGNYNVDVLMAALESRKKTLVWHDRRNKASSIWNNVGDNKEAILGGVHPECSCASAGWSLDKQALGCIAED